MPSPHHPAMDPRIERAQLWGGFHNALCLKISEELNRNMPKGFVSTVEARVRFEGEGEDAEDPDEQDRQADVAVLSQGNGRPVPGDGGGTLTLVLEPVALDPPESVYRTREYYVNVLRAPGLEIVAQVEVLSPANKKGAGRRAYHRKRREAWAAGIQTTEIDLLRHGRRLEPEADLPSDEFYAVVGRCERGPGRPRLEVFSWPIEDRLPVLPVPLPRNRGDTLFDLARCAAEVYDTGRYDTLLAGVGGSPYA